MDSSLLRPDTQVDITAIPLWQILLLAVLQGSLVFLLVLEHYILLGIAIGVLLGVPFLLNRCAHSIILLPVFLYIPFELFPSSGVQFSKLGISIVLLSGLSAVLLRTPVRQFVFPASGAITLILTAGALSIMNARAPLVSVILLVKYIVAFVCIFWIVVNFLERETDIRRVLIVIVLGGVGAAVLGIIRFSLGIEVRVFGLHGGSYGAFIGTAILLAICLVFYAPKSWIHYPLFAVLPILILSLVLSQTRSWTFGTVLGVLVVLSLHKNIATTIKVLAALSLLAGLVGWIVQLNLIEALSPTALEHATRRALQTGFFSTDDRTKILSMLLRPIIWWHGFNWYLHAPLFGVGLGNLRFSNMLTGTLGTPDDPEMGFVDNHYLNILFETGVLGVIGWAWLMILVYRECRMLVLLAHDGDEYAIVYALIGSLTLWAAGGIFWVLNNALESLAILALLIGLVFATGRLLRARHLLAGEL